MPARRALLGCAVLSLQGASVFYPCCKDCFSRADADQQDPARCRCSRCGSSCQREQVDYRYRLSLRVSRDSCIFGITVFGTCLNPFFGIHAKGLHRLVENSVRASTRSALLMKAVEDCFIGRHFIFGIKLTETESLPWLGEPVANGSSSKEEVHFIASQMILPKGSGLGGCTVVSYYRILLQKAAEYELGSTDPSKTSRPPATTLLLIPPHFPASSFDNSTLSASGLLSQSPQSSQYQDGTLTPTPLWEQSLGLVTSSAEQEEGGSIQYSGDENSRQTENKKTLHLEERGCLENPKVTEKALSPLIPLEDSLSSCTSFAKYPCSSAGKAVGNTSILNTVRLSTRQLSQTCLSSSLAWEDLPFSESLSEFLCEDNKQFAIVGETEPHLNVQQWKETSINLEISSQDNNVSHKSISVCQSHTITDSQSQMLPDITNTRVANGDDRHDLPDQIYKTPVGRGFKSQARNLCTHECDQEDDASHSLSSENEEEQLEGDPYNCSADLFGSSLLMEMSTNKLNTQAETVRTSTEASPLLPKANKQHLRSEKDAHSTPDKQTRKSKECMDRDGLIPTGTQDLEFIPPSQSTPIVAVVKGSPVTSYRNLTLAESPLCKLNGVTANQLSQYDRESTKENMPWNKPSSSHSPICTPESGFWTPDKHKQGLLAQQHPRVQRGALNTRSTGGINHRCDSSGCDVTACDYEDNGVIIPLTPVAETRLSEKLRRRRQTGNGSSNLGYSGEGLRGDGVYCKRALLDQTFTSSQKGLAQTETRDSKTVDEGILDGSHCYRLDDENEACDWSRDLFSDSI